MNTLAIDTGLALGSVAALADGTAAERPLPVGDHARLLAAALAEVAGDLGWAPRDAALVAVIRGPGSFTGLRVGVATAKAVAWAGGARLVGVSGFDVIARRTARALPDHRGRLAIAYDAGRGDVFAATAVRDEASPTGWSVSAGRIVAATAWVASLPPDACATGPALDGLGLALPATVVVPPREAWFPTAADAGAVALRLAAAGRCDDPATLVPDYLRPSYADEKRPG